MIVIAGLVIVAVTVITGVAGVLINSGHAHEVTHFAVLGYHVTGSTGTVFLCGTAVGALAMLGLSLLAAGAGRSSRRGLAARASLAQSRRETAAVSADRDDLRGQRDTARAYTVNDEQQNFTASTLGDDGTSPNGVTPNGVTPNGTDPGLRRPSLFARMFARRPASTQADPQPDAVASQAPVAQPEPPADQAAAVPAGASASAE
jgi:hypothetical protein